MSLLVSKRNSGKTVLAVSLIYNFLKKFDFSYILVFSETAHFNESGYDFLDKKCIHRFDDKFEKKLTDIFAY